MTDARPQTAAPAETDDRAGRFHRTLGVLPATAINMTQMCGIGPFVTIPLMVAAIGGPQAMFGWIVGRASSRSPTASSGPNSAPRCPARAAPTSTCARRSSTAPAG